LRKEPERRYSSGRELAADLRRFLRQEPVEARPVSSWERFMRWARRPERIRDAAVVTIVVNMCMILWLMVVGTMHVNKLVDFGVPVTWRDLFRDVFLATTGHLVGLLLGFAMLKRNVWAVNAAVVHAALLCLSALAILVGVVPAFGGAYQNIPFRMQTVPMLVLLFGIQTAVCLLGTFAMRTLAEGDSS
jgi:hypothetical protein